MGREAELVKGESWYRYFSKYSDPEFDDEKIIKRDNLLQNLWDGFFEKHLQPENGPLLSLGAGYGGMEIPLARRGYKVICLDNEIDTLNLLQKNAAKYGKNNITAVYGDLYNDFHIQFIRKGIQACVSFGTMEHFVKKDIDELIKKQFCIVPFLICMIPIATPETLKTFGAETNPEGHIDEFGIYRNFWTAEFWEQEIFGQYRVIDKWFCTNKTIRKQVDMVTLAVWEK